MNDDLDANLLDAILVELSAALPGASDPTTASALREGLRAALDELAPGPEQGPPNIRVLDGGRGAEQELSSSRLERGPLNDADQPKNASGAVHVRVVNTAAEVLKSSGDARISSLDSTDWQLVFVGPEPATYRLAVQRGRLRVACDGDLVCEVRPDQTVDVCANKIRVSAASGPAVGCYTRLA